MITSKMGSWNASTTTNMGIWPKNAERRNKKKQENVSNIVKKDTLQRIVKENNLWKRSIQEESDKKEDKQKNFGEDLE